jgi:hypothetical protein
MPRAMRTGDTIVLLNDRICQCRECATILLERYVTVPKGASVKLLFVSEQQDYNSLKFRDVAFDWKGHRVECMLCRDDYSLKRR